MTTKFDFCMMHLKTAAEDASQKKGTFPYKQVGKIVGSGLAGLGTGYAAGHITGRVLGRITGKEHSAALAKKIAPIAGTVLGIAYPMWKAREQKELSNAVESARNKAQ
jgi:hypothetical protein